jgi:hypothetical protein
VNAEEISEDITINQAENLRTSKIRPLEISSINIPTFN